MNNTDTYYINADLEARADISQVAPTEYMNERPTRTAILSDALHVPRDAIDTISSGGYHGTKLFIIELDGYLWVIKDQYGSCPHCDDLLASKHAQAYATTLLRDAYAFPTVYACKAFLKAKRRQPCDGHGAYTWHAVVDDALVALRDRTDTPT